MIFCAIDFWQPIASTVMIVPRRSIRSNSCGIAVISFDFESTATWPNVKPCCEAHALTIRYGQRHAIEIDRARSVARDLGAASHEIVDVDLRFAGGSALTVASIPVPKSRSAREMGQGIPSTYVPARNTVFLSLGMAWAEVLGAHDLFIGVNAIDYSGYPDCRPEYLEAFGNMARLATQTATNFHTLHNTKRALAD